MGEQLPEVDPLVQKIRDKDRDALAQYIDLKRPQLLTFIERRLGPGLRRKVEPDDILQEASVHCVKALGDVDLAQREPFGWLCQVAERRIIDAHRKYVGAEKRSANREVTIDTPASDASQRGVIDLLIASITSPSMAFSRDQREVKLVSALESMPEEGRKALQLRYLEGLPTKEIAAQLGKTDGSVRVLLTRSLKKLQDTLGDEASPFSR